MIYYTGIGSRQAPVWATQLAGDLAYALANKKYTLYSGRAAGMDQAFEQGAVDANGKRKIFLPWKNFRIDEWKNNKDKGYVQTAKEEDDAIDLLVELGITTDPNKWWTPKKGIRKLYARNVLQVLGTDWQHDKLITATISRFIVYYAPKNRNGNVEGGTRVAVELAQKLGIPTLCLYPNMSIRQLLAQINEYEK